MKKPKAKVLKVKVTRNHIEEGEPQSAEYCPIALALSDLGLYNVRVEGDTVEFSSTKEGDVHGLDAPKCIRQFVERFDDTIGYEDEEGDNRHKLVKPFSFKIQLPVVIPGRIRC